MANNKRLRDANVQPCETYTLHLLLAMLRDHSEREDELDAMVGRKQCFLDTAEKLYIQT